MSSANSRTVDRSRSWRSLMQKMKRDGPSTDPCGIPESTSTCDEFTPSTLTRSFDNSRVFVTTGFMLSVFIGILYTKVKTIRNPQV